MADWDRRLMQLAIHIGEWSKDRRRSVGCVIVGPHKEVRATGFNGFPRGVDDVNDARQMPPDKYLWTEHAERNAIYNAARVGISLAGCHLYVGWFPCMDCARAIVQTGIQTVIAIRPDTNDPQWGRSFRAALELFDEVGITVRYLDKEEDVPASEVTKGGRPVVAGDG